MTYIWRIKLEGFAEVGVTKEQARSIFVHDKSKLFKPWWNGCGISRFHSGLDGLRKSGRNLNHVRYSFSLKSSL